MRALVKRISQRFYAGGIWRDCRAGAAAELALVLPGLAFIVLNITDLSVYIYSRMQVDLAAQEAVGAARVLCSTSAQLPATTNCGSSLTTTMLSAAQTTSLGNRVTLGTPVENYYCASAAGDLVVAGTLASPSTDCSAVVSGSTVKPGDYINVTASYSYTPVFRGVSISAMLPATLRRTAWMRLK
jgi:hypothetical protein